MINKYLLYFSILIVFLSCTSSPSRINIQTYESLSIDKIKTVLNNEEIALSLEYISTLTRNSSEKEKDQLSKLTAEASLLLNDLFQRAINNNQYIKASNYFITARESGLILSGDWTYNKLILSSIFESDNTISSSRKSYIIRNSLDLNLVNDSELSELFEIIVAGGDKSLIDKILIFLILQDLLKLIF
jgi:hypothetical protein